MTPLWAVAASDAVLASVAVWVSAGFFRSSLKPPQRWIATVGSLLIAAAAAVGCLRFAGLDHFLIAHTALSNQAAILGLPLILLAVAWSWLDGRLPKGALVAGATALLAGLTLIQLRPASAVVSFLLVIATLAAAGNHRIVPAFMLITMSGLAWLSGTNLLGNDGRLVLLHAALAVLLLLARSALPHSPSRPAGAQLVATRTPNMH